MVEEKPKPKNEENRLRQYSFILTLSAFFGGLILYAWSPLLFWPPNSIFNLLVYGGISLMWVPLIVWAHRHHRRMMIGMLVMFVILWLIGSAIGLLSSSVAWLSISEQSVCRPYDETGYGAIECAGILQSPENSPDRYTAVGQWMMVVERIGALPVGRITERDFCIMEISWLDSPPICPDISWLNAGSVN